MGGKGTATESVNGRRNSNRNATASGRNAFGRGKGFHDQKFTRRIKSGGKRPGKAMRQGNRRQWNVPGPEKRPRPNQ